MKTRTVIVPKCIVIRHVEHPEYYGESFVLLENDMTTDVYTDENGELFTITNDKKLVKYIKSIKDDKSKVVIKHNELTMRSVTTKDTLVVAKWYQSFDLYKDLPTNEFNDLVEIYLSHAITKDAHLFMIFKKEVALGLIGYKILNNKCIVNVDLFNKHFYNKKLLIKIFKNYIINHYKIDHLNLEIITTKILKTFEEEII